MSLPEEFVRNGIPHLGGQFAQARPILFTGAGFGREVHNLAGRPLPLGPELSRLIWVLIYPQLPFEEGVLLQDIYQDALTKNPTGLEQLLQRELTVDASTIPDWYRPLFALPWYKIYTLNVDDLGQAVSRRFELPRSVSPRSATNEATGILDQISNQLIEVHLNGTIADLPHHVTFSTTQYAERLAQPDPWYMRLASELMLHPVVFIGTRLDESPLWQHVEMRRRRGNRRITHEFRPRSYLITPHLSHPRLALLDTHNVMWVPTSVEEFATQVVPQLDDAAARGHALIGQVADFGTRRRFELVADLAGTSPTTKEEFLLGADPTWSDLVDGRVANRECDGQLLAEASQRLQGRKEGPAGILVITGTAGSGKSAAAMRLALSLSAEGYRVAWMDRESNLAPSDIRREIRAEDAPDMLVFDDGEIYGGELAPLVGDAATASAGPLIVVVIRGARVGQLLPSTRLPELPRLDHTMPSLSDTDIDSLIDTLEKENRLGFLRGKPRTEQRRAFQVRADRQLIVAMIEATSGDKFEDKVTSEFSQLDTDGQIMYAVVTVASYFGFSLSKQDVLSALGDRGNNAVATLEQMVKGGVLLPASHGMDMLRARHRVIAEVLLRELQQRGVLTDALAVAAVIGAGHVSPNLRRGERPWRFLKQITNHEFLLRTVRAEGARVVYEELEPLLAWDHQYWLQRGSMELETNRLDLAKNFLSQARALAPDDPNVLNEWAYLLYKLALMDPSLPASREQADEARQILRGLMIDRGARDQYSFHVYASQGLNWVHKANQSLGEKVDFVDDLITHLQTGARLHPGDTKLQSLLDELRRERLMLVTNDR